MSHIIDILEDTGYEQYIVIDNDEERNFREKDRERQLQLDEYESHMEYGYRRSSSITSPLYIIVQILTYWFLK